MRINKIMHQSQSDRHIFDFVERRWGIRKTKQFTAHAIPLIFSHGIADDPFYHALEYRGLGSMHSFSPICLEGLLLMQHVGEDKSTQRDACEPSSSVTHQRPTCLIGI